MYGYTITCYHYSFFFHFSNWRSIFPFAIVSQLTVILDSSFSSSTHNSSTILVGSTFKIHSASTHFLLILPPPHLSQAITPLQDWSIMCFLEILSVTEPQSLNCEFFHFCWMCSILSGNSSHCSPINQASCTPPGLHPYFPTSLQNYSSKSITFSRCNLGDIQASCNYNACFLPCPCMCLCLCVPVWCVVSSFPRPSVCLSNKLPPISSSRVSVIWPFHTI